MNVTLVHDWLTGYRGGEKCLEPFCRRFPDAELLTLLRKPGSTAPAIERMRIRTSVLQRVPGIERNYRWFLPLMPWAMGRLLPAQSSQMVLSFSHAVAKAVRPPVGVPHVCYCFTPMRYAWDLRDDYFSQRRTLVGRTRDALLDRIRAWDRATAERVTHFVAISQTIAERIRRSYGRASTVIYPPVDTEFYTPAEVPREEFYLCVSALVPYKRIELAVRACNHLKRRLIVIGRGPEEARLAQLAGPTVTLAGWQSDEVIRDHLRRCRALVFPGNEDFGIAPVEALACGAPVVALGVGGATETVLPARGGEPGCGVWFDEPKVESLVERLLWFDRHPDSVCAKHARRHAERFSARRYEQELISFLERVSAGGAPSERVAA